MMLSDRTIISIIVSCVIAYIYAYWHFLLS